MPSFQEYTKGIYPWYIIVPSCWQKKVPQYLTYIRRVGLHFNSLRQTSRPGFRRHYCTLIMILLLPYNLWQICLLNATCSMLWSLRRRERVSAKPCRSFKRPISCPRMPNDVCNRKWAPYVRVKARISVIS